MPLLLFCATLYSAWILKSWNFCFEIRLFEGGAFVIAPSTTDQPIGLLLSCTSHVSIEVPLNSSTGVPSLWVAFASYVPHFGGRAPVNSTVRAAILTEPVSLSPCALARNSGAAPPRAGGSVCQTSSPLSILIDGSLTGLPPRLRNMPESCPPSSLTSSQ